MTVIGAGVVGLSCALVLAERGHPVRVVARETGAGTASAAAASLWAVPLVERSERVRAWAYATLARLRRDAGPETGVREQPARTVGVAAATPDPWLRGFTPPLREATAQELPPGCRVGTVASIPLVDTSRYLPWLRARCAEAGVDIERREVARLDDGGPAGDVVVLAAGCGSGALAGDDALRPVRGQVAVLENPGLTRTTIVRDGPLAPLFVVPRFDDVVVGGPAQDGVWDPDPDPVLERELVERAVRAEPALAGARVVGRAVGHRPVRPEVRVAAERTGGRDVVYCYGHGGAGVALSWGSARAAADLVALR
ncbi:NAD(P)/FAD-dependent oxidoreductase [Jiangella endophytica]|uniref:NAD(P)/FAD-dependent oxidoreductase n=1 Tax=Jiangella endophytica TaxID=1623398 RepID=UPI00130041F3|nr:FAD-dependent oxidoreductase [Jiangella endophytica]